VDQLRETNVFYQKAENGDFLVVTPTRAVLFREDSDGDGEADRGIILDVVPVQIDESTPTEQNQQ